MKCDREQKGVAEEKGSKEATERQLLANLRTLIEADKECPENVLGDMKALRKEVLDVTKDRYKRAVVRCLSKILGRDEVPFKHLESGDIYIHK